MCAAPQRVGVLTQGHDLSTLRVGLPRLGVLKRRLVIIEYHGGIALGVARDASVVELVLDHGLDAAEHARARPDGVPVEPPAALGAQVRIDLGEDVGAEAVDEGRSRAAAEVAARVDFLGRKLCAAGDGAARRGDEGGEEGGEEGAGAAVVAAVCECAWWR